MNSQKPSFKKEKFPELRKRFAGKVDFKGQSYLVLAKSDNAYLLEVKSKAKDLTVFQVINNDKTGKFPENRYQLNQLDPYTDHNYKNALQKYKERNQLSLNL